jgi:hypothetical protein
MLSVVVTFTNGNVVEFAAQEFRVDLLNTGGASSVIEFPYKDSKGNDSAIHLRPNDVSGLFVTPRDELRSGEAGIRYSVAGLK